MTQTTLDPTQMIPFQGRLIDRVATTPRAPMDLAAGHLQMLKRHHWDAFCTLTFSRSVADEAYATDRFQCWLYHWQLEEAILRGMARWATRPPWRGRRKAAGPWVNAYKKRRRSARPVWAVALEPHVNGGLHLHGLVKWAPMLSDMDRDLGEYLWQRPVSEGGLGLGHQCDVSSPRSQKDVTQYMTKFCAQGVSINYSRPF